MRWFLPGSILLAMTMTLSASALTPQCTEIEQARLEVRKGLDQNHPCPELDLWLFSRPFEDRAHPQMEHRLEAIKARWDARLSSATATFSSYIFNELNVPAAEKCISQEKGAGDFVNLLDHMFHTFTVVRLECAQSDRPLKDSALFNLLNKMGIEFAKGEMSVSRLSGHITGRDLGKLKAGSHRGTRFMHLDLSRMSPYEWYLVFIHEKTHSVDHLIREANVQFKDAKFLTAFQKWRVSQASDLTPEQTKLVQEWTEAGLNRGLWAEWRAWLFTFLIYQEGLRAVLWPKIDWLEEPLNAFEAQRASGESDFSSWLLKYLSEQHDFALHGSFASFSWLKEAAQTLNRSYLERGLLPPVGSLMDLVKDTPDGGFDLKPEEILSYHRDVKKLQSSRPLFQLGHAFSIENLQPRPYLLPQPLFQRLNSRPAVSRPALTAEAQPPAKNAPKLIVLAEGKAEAKGGDGSGFNGPIFGGEAIPSRTDRGVYIRDLKSAIKTCFATGDEKAGVRSVFQKVYWNLYGFYPDPSRINFKFADDPKRSPEKPQVFSAHFSPENKDDDSVSMGVQEDGETSFFYVMIKTSMGADPGGKKLELILYDAHDPAKLKSPAVKFTTESRKALTWQDDFEISRLRITYPAGGGGDFDVFSKLTWLHDPDRAVVPVTVNWLEYAFCIYGEVQKHSIDDNLSGERSEP